MIGHSYGSCGSYYSDSNYISEPEGNGANRTKHGEVRRTPKR